MTGVEVNRPHRLELFAVNSGCAHEVKGVGDPLGQVPVFPCLAFVGETECPGVHPVDVGIAALAERPQQVQCRRRLKIGLKHPFRIRHPRLRVKGIFVDDVAAIARQFHPVPCLGGGGPRLCELTGDPADLDDGLLCAERQDDGHLKQHQKRVPDAVGTEFTEALRAVATLKQECPALTHLGQPVLQIPNLARKHQWRVTAELALNRLKQSGIRVLRHLDARFRPPS